MFLNNLDKIVNNFFQNNYSEIGKDFFIFIAFIGDKYGVLILSLFFIVLLFFKRKYLRIYFLIFSLLFGAFITTILKNYFMRDRPINMLIDYGGYSFPSGHSVFAILFYGLILYFGLDLIKNKFLKIFLIVSSILLAILIIISRLYLGVHYFTDVVGGIFIGFILLFTCIYLYNLITKKLGKN